MGKINLARVLLGGLLAGVVVNIFEFVTNGVVLASQWEASMKALGHQMPGKAPIAFVVWGVHHRNRGDLALCSRAASLRPGSKDRSDHGLWLLDFRVCGAQLWLRRHGPVPLASDGDRHRCWPC